MAHWTLDQIPWDQFDASRVDPELVKLVKAAALVEYNGGDYATYLNNVFHDDDGFQAVARAWALEEVQHGAALARWAKLADPNFDFDASFKRFTDGYRIALDVNASVRGSRSGELVARCIVETGTSSYYTALAEACAEPVLHAICRKIAADELRHYKLFYTHLQRYLGYEGLGAWGRVKVALSRITESEDDELAYAYYAANHATEPYERKRFSSAYARRAYAYYQPPHIQRGISMVLKAAGLNPQGLLHMPLSNLAMWFMRRRVAKLNAAGA
ncbi:MAG: ferritin-like domain-containing protein [Rhodospirillaceae bacterium]|nr:ferritin-like domain-containing protein [Rhodospirillaceae bacterium]